MRYVCTGSFASMVTVHVNRPIPAHFLASERSYSCAFPLQLNGVPSARFPYSRTEQLLRIFLHTSMTMHVLLHMLLFLL